MWCYYYVYLVLPSCTWDSPFFPSTLITSPSPGQHTCHLVYHFPFPCLPCLFLILFPLAKPSAPPLCPGLLCKHTTMDCILDRTTGVVPCGSSSLLFTYYLTNLQFFFCICDPLLLFCALFSHVALAAALALFTTCVYLSLIPKFLYCHAVPLPPCPTYLCLWI